MKIDHIAIYTEDLERLRLFYERYFGGIANQKYHNPRTGLQTYFMQFKSGARLELMTRAVLHSGNTPKPHTGWAHLAFSAGSREEVDRLTAELAGDGYPVLSGPRVTGDGCYESCISDPDGNEIEITE